MQTTLRILLASLGAALFLVAPDASARTWTSADGSKTFEGDLKSYDVASGMVGVTLAGGKTMSFNQDKLSEADIAFLKEKGNVSPPSAPSAKSSGGAKTVPDTIPDPDGKPADMSKPVQVFILMGQSNMLGMGKVNGSLDQVVKEGKFPYLVDDSGAWTTRKDVRNVRVMNFKDYKNDWLTAADTKTIGPELGIGSVLGEALDAPVMLLKSCIGNRSLGWDLLPPGSEPYEAGGKTIPGYRGTPSNPKGNGEKVEGEWYAGKQWDDDIDSAKKVLENLGKYYPDAKKYEIAGFIFWQGDKDRYDAANAERYEVNLVNFINALRKEFDVPNAKFVCATLGQTKKGASGNEGKILDAQLAVDGESGKHKEFKGNVATFYSNPVCKGGASNSHYGGNAETYMGVGEGLGRAMAELLK